MYTLTTIYNNYPIKRETSSSITALLNAILVYYEDPDFIGAIIHDDTMDAIVANIVKAE